MENAARFPRAHWGALYASLGGVLLAMLTGEALWTSHESTVDIVAGLLIVTVLARWVHTNRAGLDVSGAGLDVSNAVALGPPEGYTDLMGRAGAPRVWRRYVEAALVVAIATGAAYVMSGHVDESSLAMVYLAGVVAVATRGSRGAALFSCVASVAAFDFFFVPPHFTLEVAESRFLVTFAVMFVVALVITTLTRRARAEGEKAEAERVRNALLSAISHDLRTPLTAITGAASTLLDSGDRLDTRTRRELLQSIHEEADRLNRLVHNLVDTTRVESGALQLKREWFPLDELIGGALSRLSLALGDRRVTTRLAPDLPPVPVDGLLVEQALINLLDNAAKHTPPGEPIEVAAWREDGGVTVEIADHGPGLGPGEESRVFEKFYRRGRAGGGIGLGLTVCRGIVESHGGRVWAENRPGGGARFRFTLPVDGHPPSVDNADG